MAEKLEAFEAESKKAQQGEARACSIHVTQRETKPTYRNTCRLVLTLSDTEETPLLLYNPYRFDQPSWAASVAQLVEHVHGICRINA